MNWDFAILFATAVLTAAIYGYLRGLETGRTKERNRCMYLVHSALMRKYSATTRWVGNAIGSGEEKLMKPEDFFGDEDDT